MRIVIALALAAGIATASAAAAASAPNGDQILARAAAATGVHSYTVPVQFDVHLHKPIGLRANVEGVVDYRAPRQGALVITKAHGLIGGFFKGTYDIDLVPQTWPTVYRVTAVSREAAPGGPVTVLEAMPKSAPGDIAGVEFRLAGHPAAPVGATWKYSDGSTISLTFANGRVGADVLPQTATVHVDKPKDKLDATVTYGAYALNAPVDPAVFTAK
jgi:hypothetical protein